jgi:hypothetical protein
MHRGASNTTLLPAVSTVSPLGALFSQPPITQMPHPVHGSTPRVSAFTPVKRTAPHVRFDDVLSMENCYPPKKQKCSKVASSPVTVASGSPISVLHAEGTKSPAVESCFQHTPHSPSQPSPSNAASAHNKLAGDIISLYAHHWQSSVGTSTAAALAGQRNREQAAKSCLCHHPSRHASQPATALVTTAMPYEEAFAAYASCVSRAQGTAERLCSPLAPSALAIAKRFRDQASKVIEVPLGVLPAHAHHEYKATGSVRPLGNHVHRQALMLQPQAAPYSQVRSCFLSDCHSLPADAAVQANCSCQPFTLVSAFRCAI